MAAATQPKEDLRAIGTSLDHSIGLKVIIAVSPHSSWGAFRSFPRYGAANGLDDATARADHSIRAAKVLTTAYKIPEGPGAFLISAI